MGYKSYVVLMFYKSYVVMWESWHLVRILMLTFSKSLNQSESEILFDLLFYNLEAL